MQIKTETRNHLASQKGRHHPLYKQDFPGGAVDNPPASTGGHGIDSWSMKILHTTEPTKPVHHS